jgi:hypothetical protein
MITQEYHDNRLATYLIAIQAETLADIGEAEWEVNNPSHAEDGIYNERHLRKLKARLEYISNIVDRFKGTYV